MARIISRSAGSGGSITVETVTDWFREYVLTQNTIKKLNERLSAVKKDITAAVEALGEEDEKGHLLLPIDGVEGYKAAQRQRKVSTGLNTELLERLAEEKGFKDRIYKLVPVLDEDEVYKAFAEDLISEDELDAIFPKSVSYAFIPLKG